MSVSKVATGEALARLAYDCDGYLFNTDETLSTEAKEVAASIFDYLRDLGDIGDATSFSEKLAYNRELDAMLGALERLGCVCYLGLRTAKVVGANCVDKTPMPFTTGYLTVVSAENDLSEMMVPRRIS